LPVALALPPADEWHRRTLSRWRITHQKLVRPSHPAAECPTPALTRARFPDQSHRWLHPAIAVHCCNDRANAARTVHDLPLLRDRVAGRFPTDAARKISWDERKIPPAAQFPLHAISLPARPVVDRKMAVLRSD